MLPCAEISAETRMRPIWTKPVKWVLSIMPTKYGKTFRPLRKALGAGAESRRRRAK